MPKRIKLTDRIFIKTSHAKVMCHLLEPGIEIKSLKNLYSKFNRRARELGIEVNFNCQLVKPSTDEITQCITYELVADSGRLAERSPDDLIQWSIGLSVDDHTKWEAAKQNIPNEKKPLESWVFEHDKLTDLYVLKAEGYSMRDLATAFKKRESRPELNGKVKFIYDPKATIITLTPQEHALWENYCDQVKAPN